MNICFISPYSIRNVNGISTFVIGLCKELKKKDHIPIIISKYEDAEVDLEDIFGSEIDLTEIENINTKYLASLHLTYRILITIFKKRHNIDVLHLQQPDIINAFIAVFGKMLGIPTITTFHLKVPNPINPLKKIINSFFVMITVNCSDIITFVSEETKKSFKSHKGIVIKNGIDTDHFYLDTRKRRQVRQKFKFDDELVLLFVGRWTINKGIYELLEAFSQIKKLINAKIRLVLIGSGKGSGENDKILRKIYLLELNKDVLPVGVVQSIQEYYCMADIFILPSYLEGLPMALLEAMSCQLPSIASNVGGNPELIVHNKNGLLVEPQNVNDLIQKILWCIDHRDELKVIGINAAETVRKQFSLMRIAEEYIELYTSLKVKK